MIPPDDWDDHDEVTWLDWLLGMICAVIAVGLFVVDVDW